MINLKKNVATSWWEIPFQVALYAIVFIFFISEGSTCRASESHVVQGYDFAFFLNYAAGACIISYFLFPSYLYKNRYVHFFVATAIVIALVIIMEEFVLEKIYFPDKRGKYFHGVFFSLLDVLPVMVILCGFKLAWDVIQQQRQVEDLKASVAAAELRFLKTQINPHFLFNNLNNLYSHALENSPKTPEIILEMSSVLRYVLYECHKEFVPLASEFKQLENFIKLYEMQIEGRGVVRFNSTGVVDSSLSIAPMILIVFVENAFKHSASNQADNIDIDIQLILDQGTLMFTCINTYEVVEKTDPTQASGIGLENVRKRLEYIYPDRYELNIRATPENYRVHLRINLSTDDDVHNH